MNGFAKLVQDGDRWVITSSTQLPGQATVVDNGHAELLPDHSPATLGAAVRRAWDASATLPPSNADDVLDQSSAARQLGYAGFDDLLRAKARSTGANLIRGRVRLTSTVNRGPRGSFSGTGTVDGPATDCTDAELGQALLDAAARSR